MVLAAHRIRLRDQSFGRSNVTAGSFWDEQKKKALALTARVLAPDSSAMPGESHSLKFSELAEKDGNCVHCTLAR